jgi:hypothetical protein
MNVFEYGRYKKQIDEATDGRTSRFGYENVKKDELNGYAVERGKVIKRAGDCIDGRTYTDISEAEIDILDRLLTDYTRQHLRTRYFRDNVIYIRKEKKAETSNQTESNRQESSEETGIDGVISGEMLDGYSFETDLDEFRETIINHYSNQQ